MFVFYLFIDKFNPDYSTPESLNTRLYGQVLLDGWLCQIIFEEIIYGKKTRKKNTWIYYSKK